MADAITPPHSKFFSDNLGDNYTQAQIDQFDQVMMETIIELVMGGPNDVLSSSDNDLF